MHQVAGKGHDDLGRKRNACRFNAHEQSDTDVSRSRDGGNDEVGDEGQKFFGHSKAVYLPRFGFIENEGHGVFSSRRERGCFVRMKEEIRSKSMAEALSAPVAESVTS